MFLIIIKNKKSQMKFSSLFALFAISLVDVNQAIKIRVNEKIPQAVVSLIESDIA